MQKIGNFFFGRAYNIKKKGSDLRTENTYSEKIIQILTTGCERGSPEEEITS